MKKIVFSFCLIVWSASILWAQRTVAGRVFDNQGMPLSEVTVYAVGSHAGTVTDEEGRYSLEIPAESTVLKFAYDSGWSSPEAPLDRMDVLNVIMVPYIPFSEDEMVIDPTGLDHPVVIRGKVFDEHKTPLRGARVSLSEAEGTIVSITDAEGNYKLEIPAGTNVVRVSYGQHWSAAKIVLVESSYMDVFLPSRQTLKKWEKRLDKKQRKSQEN